MGNNHHNEKDEENKYIVVEEDVSYFYIIRNLNLDMETIIHFLYLEKI